MKTPEKIYTFPQPHQAFVHLSSVAGANLLEADEKYNLKPRVVVSSKHDSVRIYDFETYEAAQGCLTELRRRVEDYYTSLRTRRKRA